MKKTQDTTPNSIILDNLGEPIHVHVRYSLKAKRIGIKVSEKGPELVLPKNGYAQGYSFLLTKESWIRRVIKNIPKVAHSEKNKIPIFNEIHEINHIKATSCKIEIKDQKIDIYSRDESGIHVLKLFLQKILLTELLKMIKTLSEEYNLHPAKIQLTQNKGKWGSCSRKTHLTFNWRLVFAPKYVIKYIVVHELCHIKEMNHSKNFWALVEVIYPQYKLAKLWLKQNSFALHQYFENHKG